MMKINLKRQTTWGCVRHFIVYKNGVKQGKLFNNITTEIDAEIGDTLEFREGLFRFSQKIKVNSETKEILISNTNQIKRLFSLFIILFIAISLLSLSIASLKVFLFTEISAFILLNHLFRYRSYNFNIEPMDSLLHDISGIEIY
ncbi:hypothetical protein A5821_000534 [Enterococcus sp. 7F3_DIV0205]|uniref:Uncharacterized protein n=2 Tax=Candidatus Enterococcus palustris TaxID=1834189 RepID=A0AAQ3W6C1_9ENTE|nr:hypothetical protein A5821_000876 [Enterococcus sp. 7F3_DIV0205]